MKKKTNITSATVPKSNRKFIERGNIDITNTQLHDRSLSWLGTGTSMKSGGVKLVL
jgi:hypothetical protein